MSNRRSRGTLTVLTAIVLAGPAAAETIEAPSLSAPQKIAVCQSVWTAGRTVAFGAQSRRIQMAVELATFVWRRTQSSKASLPPRLTLNDADFNGTKPTPLPTTTVSQKPIQNSNVATLQRTYRTLVRLGLYDEAGEVARRIAQPEKEVQNSALVGAVAVEHSPAPGIRQASFVAPASNAWKSAGKKRLSCRFEGSPLVEVARFIGAETGCCVELPIGARSAPGVHFACKDLPADVVLSKIAESYGWVLEPTASGVALNPPLALPLRDARLPILR